MSIRQRVGWQEIEQFLIQVGQTRRPGRLYLIGGAALVHRGIRPRQTLDIAIHITHGVTQRDASSSRCGLRTSLTPPLF